MSKNSAISFYPSVIWLNKQLKVQTKAQINQSAKLATLRTHHQLYNLKKTTMLNSKSNYLTKPSNIYKTKITMKTVCNTTVCTMNISRTIDQHK
jgi:hypothetical protein